MRVRFIRPATPVGFGYIANEVADLPDDAARKLIEQGYAEQVSQKAETVETRESKAAPEQRTRTKGKKK